MWRREVAVQLVRHTRQQGSKTRMRLDSVDKDILKAERCDLVQIGDSVLVTECGGLSKFGVCPERSMLNVLSVKDVKVHHAQGHGKGIA